MGQHVEPLSQLAFDLAEEIGDALDHHGATLDLLQRELCGLDGIPFAREREIHALLAALRLLSADAARKAAQIARSGVT